MWVLPSRSVIVQRVVPALIESGHYDWPWLGVSGYTVNPPLVKAMSLPVEQGAYVSTVTEGGPALAAGLVGTKETITQDGRTVEMGGDVITAIDGQPVKTFDDMLVYLSLQTSPGQEVTLTILRDGKYQDVKLTAWHPPVSSNLSNSEGLILEPSDPGGYREAAHPGNGEGSG